MATELDLRQLAVDRSQRAAPTQARRRPIVSRYLIPGGVLLGFAAMLGWAAREQFLSRRAVTVVPVVVTRAEVQQSGAPLFQAPGWMEPRPTRVLVTALAEGVVEQLLVTEGQDIAAGAPVARLIDIDTRLSLEQAQAEQTLREADLASAEAELKAAKSR